MSFQSVSEFLFRIEYVIEEMRNLYGQIDLYEQTLSLRRMDDEYLDG